MIEARPGSAATAADTLSFADEGDEGAPEEALDAALMAILREAAPRSLVLRIVKSWLGVGD